MTSANKYVLSLSHLSIKLADLRDREARAMTEYRQAKDRLSRIRVGRKELEASIKLLKRKGAPKGAASVAEPENPWGATELGRRATLNWTVGERVVIKQATSTYHNRTGVIAGMAGDRPRVIIDGMTRPLSFGAQHVIPLLVTGTRVTIHRPGDALHGKVGVIHAMGHHGEYAVKLVEPTGIYYFNHEALEVRP
jgi:hypothetical protein